MKNEILILAFLMCSIVTFGQYTENKLPSGLTETTSIGDSDYTIVQKNGEVIVKATRMDTIAGYLNAYLNANMFEVSAFSGTSGNIVITDGSAFRYPTLFTYDGKYSVTLGYRTGVGGYGNLTVGGQSSFPNENAGGYSIVCGASNTNEGNSSIIVGQSNEIGTGLFVNSIFGGGNTITAGDASLVCGSSNTTAAGLNLLGGKFVVGYSPNEFVFGQYSRAYTPTSTTAWSLTDRLFTIANGTSTAILDTHNAFVMLKNGNTTAIGDWTIDGEFTTSDISTLTKCVTQFHRIADLDVTVADTWTDFQLDTIIALESTGCFTFNADSTGVIYTGVDCIMRVQGCAHSLWTGSDGTDVSAYTRVLVNGVEARCLQSNINRERKTGDNAIIPYTGTVYIETGQEIAVQYYVTNIGMDFEGVAVFDNPVAMSVNFEFMSLEQ